MRIVHIGPIGFVPVQPTGSGGIGKAICFLTGYLAEWGHDVGIIDYKSPVHQTIKTKAKFHEVWIPPLVNKGLINHLVRVAFFCTSAILTLRRLDREKKIDIIQTYNQFPVAAVVLAKRLFRWKVPIIHFVTNSTLLLSGFEYKYGNMFETWALRRVNHVTIETEYIRQELISRFGIEASRSTQVYSGIDMDGITSSIRASSSRRAASRDKTVFCAARIHPAKNQLAIVKAIPKILRAHPEVRFIFTGPVRDPAYLGLMRKFIEDNQLSEQVEITGEVPQESLYELYHSATIFVFPTLYETQGQVLLEAMAFGLPVIASRIGPIEDMVNLEKGSAILVDPNNIDEIADSVIRLLEDESLREELSARGKKLVSQRFSWEEIAKEMLKVYEKVLL